MKFSYNWIRDYVPELDAPARQLERLITMRTAECEGIEETGGLLAGACAARVVSVEPIAGGYNVKAVVSTAAYGEKTVVCGAPNCRAGMSTVYVPVGKKEIHGVESDGMLASGAELSVNRQAEGILETGALDGCAPDSIIEIDNKSITHRPDLWGHYGMAREVAAILRKPLRDPVDRSLVPAVPAAIGVEIEDFDLCPRYSALVFENVTVRPSPLWLQYRLTAIGLNPINNVVDMTNYIMSELAQPMHAFDRDLLHGDTIFIRRAREGESLLALNEEEYELGPANLVIADANGPVALAGVIGGMDSAIVDGTTRIVLESACFNASSVRRTSAGLKLRTDASMRFEKSQDPANTVRGLARAVELLRELSPGIRLVGGVARSRPIAPPPPILLPMDWLVRKLGKIVGPDEVRDILQRLAFGVTEAAPGVFSVTVPSWRATKDISVKDDLVEEVGRMIGYDSIVPRPPAVLTSVPPANPERAFHRRVRAIFQDQGFTEVYNYSFVAEADARAFGMQPEEHVMVANPIAPNQSLLRMSLLPELRGNVLENSKRFDAFRLFEIGREIHKQSPGLPREIPHLAAAIYSKEGDGAAGLFEMKRVAECLMPGAEARPCVARAYEHAARAAEIYWEGAVTGRLFELHPSLGEGRTAMLDLDLIAVQAAAGARHIRYTPIRRYPSSGFDLSVVAGGHELAGDLRGKLAALAGPLLESIEYQRQYAGPPLPEGTKSVSFRVTVGSAERTLSSEEVGEIRARLIEGMRAQGYDLRL